MIVPASDDGEVQVDLHRASMDSQIRSEIDGDLPLKEEIRLDRNDVILGRGKRNC